MTNSYSELFVHIIFSTKGRRPLLTDEMRPALHNYIAGIVKNCGSYPIKCNSVEDHLHALVGLNKNKTVSNLVQNIKTGSNLFLQAEYPHLKEIFSWQEGFGCFSVSHSAVDAVARYIQNQREHHKKFSFETEYRTMLTKCEINWDEKYIFG